MDNTTLTVKFWALGLNWVKRSFGASITVIMTLRSDKSELSVAKNCNFESCRVIKTESRVKKVILYLSYQS